MTAVAANKIAEKLQNLADGLTKTIEEKRRPMTQAWTPKRGREEACRRHDAGNLERVQKSLQILSSLHLNGDIPAELASLNSKSTIHDYVRKSWISTGYYEGHTAEEYADKSPVGKKLQELLDQQEMTPEELERQARMKIAKMEEKLRFNDIPGFFPTPPAVIQQMLDAVTPCEGELVLEPSAGKGDIAEAYLKTGAQVHCIELRPTLVEILQAKGLQVISEPDFMEFKLPDGHPGYDVIAMNPPFEKQQDAKHFVHAVENILKPGGRIVAILSPSAQTRDSSASGAVRDVIEKYDLQVDDLPDGSFSIAFNRTNVSAILVYGRKE